MASLLLDDLELTAPAPQTVTGLTAQTIGQPGITQYYYWVVAHFPIGVSVTGPAFVRDGPDILSSTNFIRVVWNAAIGATSYDVLRTDTGEFPDTAGNFAVTTATTQTHVDDTGAALASYSTTGLPYGAPVNCGVHLNNRDYAKPTMEFPCQIRVNTIVFADGSSMSSAGAAGVPAGATGQVQWNNAGAFGASPNLFWDNVNSRLGIGTSAPGYTLDIVGDVNITGTYRVNGVPIATGGGGVPAGATGQIQWNNAGAFGASANLTWNNTNIALAVGNDGSVLPVAAVGFDWLIVGPSAPTTTYGVICVAGNTTTSGNDVGGFTFVNYANAASDKRIAYIYGTLDGAANSGAIRFATYSAGTGAERMRITSAGRVGIGVTAPAYTLDIAGDCNITGTYRVNGVPLATGGTTPPAGATGQIQWNNAGAFGATANLVWDNANSALAVGNDGSVLPSSTVAVQAIIGSTTGPSQGFITLCANLPGTANSVGSFNFANYNIAAAEKRIATISGLTDGATNSGAFIFYLFNAGTAFERMRINSLGNVGIGNPATLPVAGLTGPWLIVGPSTASANYGIVAACGNTTTSGSVIGEHAFVNYGSPSADKRIAYIDSILDGAGNAGSIRFFTSNAGTIAEAMRIASTGYVGIGLPANATYQLELSLDSAGKPATNTWTVVSDIRTKRNVYRFDGDMDVIRKLNPIVGEYNGKAGTPNGTRVVSFDAEELQKLISYAVTSTRRKLNSEDAEETDILGVNIHEVLFHMLRAIQKLDAGLTKLGVTV
jgi:hypothetical protein